MTAPGDAARPEAPRPLIHEGAALALLGAGIVAFFWPVFAGRLPAPGDGYLHAFPHLTLLGRALAAGSLPLWNPYEFSGFPWLATGQAGILYPPNWIAALLPPVTAMTVVVLSTYLIAGLGTYRLARQLGASPPAAVVGGYTYALSGFMVAHLGHTPMVNAAAWLPWLFLAVEHLRGRMRWPWLAAASGIVALQIAAGHFQVPAYAGLAVAIYVVVAGGEVPGWRARLGWVGRVALAGAMGGLLAAVQILPALELARESARAQISFEFFTQYHLPVRQLPMLLFPYLFGGAWPPASFPATYLGQGNLGELAGYAGVLPFVLATSAVTALWRQPRVRGWAAVGGAAVILALGPATPASRLLFAVPGYNAFRVPARHLMSFGLAVAILAALALAGMLDGRGEATRRRAWGCAWAIGAGMGLIAAAVLIRPAFLARFLPPPDAGASSRGVTLALPLALAVLAVAMTGVLRRTPSRRAQALAAALTLLDLAAFGQFFGWHAWPTASSVRQVPAPVAFLRRAVEDPPRRIFTALGDYASLGSFLQVALHGLLSANGYDPLILARYAEFLGMNAAGVVSDPARLERGRPLDLLSVRHVLVPPPRRFATRAGPLAVLGPGEWIEYGLDRGDPVALHVVSTLAYSGEVPEGTPIARVLAFPEAGAPGEGFLRAGIETGAWDARGPASPRGSGASANRTFTATEDGRTALSLYEARVPLGEARRIVRVRVEHLGPVPYLFLGIAAVRAVGERGEAIAATGPTVPLALPPRWVQVFRDPTAEVYENPDALPRAWLVPESVPFPDEAAVLEVMRSGRLPDGRAFDPRALALLGGRDAPRGRRWAADPGSRVEPRQLSANRIEVQVRAPAGGYLVLSEVDYPGWQAALDGVPIRHDRVNYVLRGLPIPPGTHRVTFVFRPRSVLWGGLISAATGVVLIGLAWPRRRQL